MVNSWDKILTVAVAVYGAGLSTYIFLVRRKEKQRRINVQIKFGFTPIGPDIGPQMIFVEASNPGNRTVRLTSVGLLLPDGRQMVWIHPVGTTSLPHDLGEGQSCNMWMPAEELEEQLAHNGFRGRIKVRGFFGDALGKKHQSKRKALTIRHS